VRSRGLVVVSILLAAVTACSGSDGGDDPEQPPTLDRIDGPAQVDPSFDPFATTTSSPPPAADDGG
jgi:hypothetical protein